MPGSFGVYSHNNYVELLFSVGVPGVVAYYSMYLYVLYKAISAYKNTHDKLAIMIVAFVVCCMFADYAMVNYYVRITIFTLLMMLKIVEGIKCSSSQTNTQNALL